MGTLLSPGVLVTHSDQSQVVAIEGDSAAVYVGDFEKGPVGNYILISSVAELKENFGYPNKVNYNDWYQVYNFLQYSGAIYVVRAGNINGTKYDSGLKFFSNKWQLGNEYTKLDVTFVKADGATAYFEPTTAFEVDDVTSFSTNNLETNVVSVRDTTLTFDNADYFYLEILSDQSVTDHIGNEPEVIEGTEGLITIDTNGVLDQSKGKFEVSDTDIMEVVLSADDKTANVKFNKEGSASVTFYATKEDSNGEIMELSTSLDFAIQMKPLLDLKVTFNDNDPVIGTASVNTEEFEVASGSEGTLKVEATEGAEIKVALADSNSELNGEIVKFIDNTTGSAINSRYYITATKDGYTEAKVLLVFGIQSQPQVQVSGVLDTTDNVYAGRPYNIDITSLIPDSAYISSIVSTDSGATINYATEPYNIIFANAGEQTITITGSAENYIDGKCEIKVNVLAKPQATLEVEFEDVDWDDITEGDTISYEIKNVNPSDAVITITPSNTAFLSINEDERYIEVISAPSVETNVSVTFTASADYFVNGAVYKQFKILPKTNGGLG